MPPTFLRSEPSPTGDGLDSADDLRRLHPVPRELLVEPHTSRQPSAPPGHPASPATSSMISPEGTDERADPTDGGHVSDLVPRVDQVTAPSRDAARPHPIRTTAPDGTASPKIDVPPAGAGRLSLVAAAG